MLQITQEALCEIYGDVHIKNFILEQFYLLAEKSEISKIQVDKTFTNMFSKTDKVKSLIDVSFLKDKFKRSYFQAYQTRLKKLQK